MELPRIWVDFNNGDAKGRLRLSCRGTLDDITRQQIQLREGLAVMLYSEDEDQDGEPDELRVDGIIEFSKEESGWVAAINWDAIHHASTEPTRVTLDPTRNVG